MKERIILDISEPIPPWLPLHPQFQPWHAGLSRVTQIIASFIAEYSPLYYDNTRSEKPEREENRLKNRLFSCLVYHWEHADSRWNLERVLDYLRNSLSFRPMEEIIFTEALYDRQNAAAKRFEQYIIPYMRQTGSRLMRILQLPDDGTNEWQNDFYIFLLEQTDDRPCVILRYRGMVPARNWLAMVFTHFVNNAWRKKKRVPAKSLDCLSSQEGIVRSSDQQASHISRFADFLAQSVKQIITDLDSESRMRLEYSYLEKLTNLRIAAILQEDPSKACRKRQAVEERIAAQLQNILSESNEWNEYADLFSSKDVSDLLKSVWGEIQ